MTVLKIEPCVEGDMQSRSLLPLPQMVCVNVQHCKRVLKKKRCAIYGSLVTIGPVSSSPFRRASTVAESRCRSAKSRLAGVLTCCCVL